MTASPRPLWPRAVGLLIGLSGFGLVAWSQTNLNPPMMVVIGNLTHNCGTTPPGLFGRHSWSIRNDGTVPLRLRTRFTSGHCGFSLWQGEYHFVPPGAQITVSLTWPTPQNEAIPYSHHAEVWTNDPELSKLKFQTFGITGTSLDRR